MKQALNILLVVLVVVLIICGVKACQYFDTKATESSVVTDTCIVYDTIKYIKPIPRDSVVIHYVTKMLPVAQKSDTVVVTVRDSVLVEIPISQKEYKDSTYHAFVSGYMPSLDSITVYPKTMYINSTITNNVKNKRWGIGIHAGYGMCVDNSVVRVTPYIGVGVSYNIFSW